MPKYIKRREYIESTTYSLFFANDSEGMSGYGFDCDAAGKVFRANLTDCARETYDRLSSGVQPYAFSEIQRFDHSYADPAVIACDCCGAHVTLYGFTNTCEKCGTDYNMSGQELAPREQWGEEPGESYADLCVNLDRNWHSERGDL